jgi:hypothetical protein
MLQTFFRLSDGLPDPEIFARPLRRTGWYVGSTAMVVMVYVLTLIILAKFYATLELDVVGWLVFACFSVTGAWVRVTNQWRQLQQLNLYEARPGSELHTVLEIALSHLCESFGLMVFAVAAAIGALGTALGDVASLAK